MPALVAVALRPPKSAAAVPDISEVMPMDAMTINTADQPTIYGAEKRNAAKRIEKNRAGHGAIGTACRK